MLVTQTSGMNYEELYQLDILGLADAPESDQETVYVEFREQLTRDSAGWYKTGLPWKGPRSAQQRAGEPETTATSIEEVEANQQHRGV